MNTKLKNKIENLPQSSGVYFFYDKKEIIYIGKAINIKARVKNHFMQPSHRDNLFMEKVSSIKCTETNSEIEALILEANLIKKHLPKFNIVWRDDKNYFYVAIAKNKIGLPYFYITHQLNKSNVKGQLPNVSYIGPFIEGNSLKKTLKYLRRVFPYYTSGNHPKQKCTWCHLDLCPGPFLFENSHSLKASEGLREYKNNIQKLILVLRGQRKNVLNYLKKKMGNLAREKKFEKAGKIRDKMQALERIMEHSHIIDGQTASGHLTMDNWDKAKAILQKILGTKSKIERIECYDISNIQGKNATGSMVVFVNGSPERGQYKKFRIRMKQKPNDIAMLKEVFTRRFMHPEWNFPQIMLIDGGKAQLNAAISVKENLPTFFTPVKKVVSAKNIKVISIAKGRQELFIEGRKQPIPLKKLPQEIYNLIKHLDDEAHRFAITYHKKLRKEAMGL